MLEEDGLGGEGGSLLRQSQQGVEKEDKEENTASCEGTGCGVRLLEEERTDDQTLEDNTAPFSKQRRPVADHDGWQHWGVAEEAR